MGGSEGRNVNLDALRAGAILLVIAFHVPQIFPEGGGSLLRVTWYGQFGVDLFFVLSGWLIGGLYWREYLARGTVRLGTFWARRWLRTLPPYFVALAVSWAAVAWERGEAFDPLFLVFLQNYEAVIPFFLVSWSLCVEEHFYVVAPLLLLLVRAPPVRGIGVAAAAVALAIPTLARLVEWQPDMSGFGYFQTATHLRADGLVVGLVLATVAYRRPDWFPPVMRMGGAAAILALAVVVALEFVGGRTHYALGGLAYAAMFGSFLLVGLRAPALPRIAASILVPIGIAAYSTYLTHPLMLHVAAEAYERLGFRGWVPYLALVAMLVIPAAAIFYFVVERTSIRVRDRYWPRPGAATARAAVPA